MKKFIYLLLLLLPLLGLSQTQTTSSGKYKMFIPTLGAKSDSVAVWNGTDKLLKYIPRSSFVQSLQQMYDLDPANLIVNDEDGQIEITPFSVMVSDTVTGRYTSMDNVQGFIQSNNDASAAVKTKADNITESYNIQQPDITGGGDHVPTYALKVNPTTALTSDSSGTIDMTHTPFVLSDGTNTMGLYIDQFISTNGTSTTLIEPSNINLSKTDNTDSITLGVTADDASLRVGNGTSAEISEVRKNSLMFQNGVGMAAGNQYIEAATAITGEQHFKLPDPGAGTYTFLTSADGGAYVPYTGATTDVDLGTHSLSAAGLNTLGDVNMASSTYMDGLLLINGAGNVNVGDAGGDVNSTFINVNDPGSAITLNATNGVVVNGNLSATNLSGTNTGDQTAITGNAGTATSLQNTRTIGTITGDATSAGSSFNGTANNSNALTLATVNSNVGNFGAASNVSTITVNGKGLVTAASSTPIQITESQVTNLLTDLAAKQATIAGATGISSLGTAMQLIRVNSAATALEYYTPAYPKVNTVDGTATSVTTTEAVLGSVLIAGGDFTAGKMMTIFANFTKNSATSGYTVRIRVGTAATVAGSTQVATLTPSAAQVTSALDRTLVFKSGNILDFYPATQAAASDRPTPSATNRGSMSLDPSSPFYIVFTVLFTSNTGETVTMNNSLIERK